MVEERIYPDIHSKCCDAHLQDAPDDYRYKIKNPDTRWFVCTDCGTLGTSSNEGQLEG